MIDQKEGETDFTIKIHYDDVVRSYYKNTVNAIINKRNNIYRA